ncbi:MULTISPECIES: TIGR02391 family protein [unclassified Streptomyces]|uniref:TIGR02391 family protein n=1 Tax=unclassified Streptomyces TaxID=2593676 RepID=UPI003420AFE2
MDHQWAVERLTEFIREIDVSLESERRRTAFESLQPPSKKLPPDHEDQLVRLDTLVTRIAEQYEEGLGTYTYPTTWAYERWQAARERAVRALALAESAEAYEAFLQPRSPVIGAENLHSWVWESARPLWAAEAHQEAVLAAARTVNARLQQKLGRHDVAESDLVLQSFDLKEPQSARPRIRMPGDDRSQPSWISAQEGAKFFGVGCFRAIRNIAAHVENTHWTEQQALEYLCAFSAFARWVDSATVETAHP